MLLVFLDQDNLMKRSDESERSGGSDRSAIEIREASPKVGSEEQVRKEPRPPARQVSFYLTVIFFNFKLSKAQLGFSPMMTKTLSIR